MGARTPPQSKHLARKNSKEVLLEAHAQNWSVPEIQALSEFLITGDVAKACRIFQAPKPIVIDWIRCHLARMALTCPSEKVQAECWKTLLLDMKGMDQVNEIKIDLIISPPHLPLAHNPPVDVE